MKTISFYSFKGGMFRTYTMANLGVALARLGHKVALVDMDLRAPDLEQKFAGSGLPAGESTQGVLELMCRFDHDKGSFPGDLERYYSECAIHNAGAGQTGEKGGSLLIFPAKYKVDLGKFVGRFESDQIRELRVLLEKKHWKKAGYLYQNGFFDVSQPARSKTGVVQFMKKLKRALTKLGVQYLLIDSQSGVTDDSLGITALVSDRIIFFFAHTLGNSAGISLVLSELRLLSAMDITGQITGEIVVTPVLSHVPPDVETKLKPRLVEDVAAKLEEPTKGLRVLDSKWPHVLHSFMDLEIAEKLMFHGGGYVEDVLLTRELLGLLARACPEVVKRGALKVLLGGPRSRRSFKAINESVEGDINRLWRQMKLEGSVDKINRAYRIFEISDSKGVMINLSDGQRNVSFKTDTFWAMLKDIHTGLIAKEEKVKADAEDQFYSSGVDWGRKFGESLVSDVWVGSGQKMTDVKRIQAWCKFDSRVGFGRLELRDHGLEKDDFNHIRKGKIEIRNNFLAKTVSSEKGREDANLCELMRGYIAGVLERILFPSMEYEVKVTHPKKAHDKKLRKVHGEKLRYDVRVCVFSFEVKNLRRRRRMVL